jgi:uncharacterized membrane protein
MKQSVKDHRFWEIDTLRGIAIILMIYFHFLYDLNLFGVTNLSLYTGFFLFLAYGTASIFVLLFGISLTLKFNSLKKTSQSTSIVLNFLFRGIKILILGFIITFITYLYIPDRFVIFGILHFIGLSLFISYPFLILQKSNVILGVSLIVLGVFLRMFTVKFWWGLPIGFIPTGFSSVDYFPLIPWFGIVLLGIAIGNIFYKDRKRRYRLNNYSTRFPIPFLCFLGRNSLIIYFFHQPILFGMIYLFLL